MVKTNPPIYVIEMNAPSIMAIVCILVLICPSVIVANVVPGKWKTLVTSNFKLTLINCQLIEGNVGKFMQIITFAIISSGFSYTVRSRWSNN